MYTNYTNVMKRNGSMKFVRRWRWRRHRVARSRNSSRDHVYIYIYCMLVCRYVICIVHTYAYATRILERTPPVRTTICWRARICGREIFNISQWWIFVKPYPPDIQMWLYNTMYCNSICRRTVTLAKNFFKS